MNNKSPAQIFFERIINTWLEPCLIKNKISANIQLSLVLIIWENIKDSPSIYINQDVFRKVKRIKIISAGPLDKNQIVTSRDISGLISVILNKAYWSKPYIFICQGNNGLYYVDYDKMGNLKDAYEFKRLKNQLRSQGVTLTTGTTHIPIYLDSTSSFYTGSSIKKRKHTIESKKLHIEKEKKNAKEKVKREFQLPTYVIHSESNFLPFIQEARETYIDGHYFSCVATAATTADLICISLVEKYEVKRKIKIEIKNVTLGQKLQRLLKMNFIDEDEYQILNEINEIRTKYLHPKKFITKRTSKKDALKIILLLHKYLESTFSVFRDYSIKNGKLVPKLIE